MAPLLRQLLNDSQEFETKVCVTAQHREMLNQVLEFFKIVPDFDLNLMKPDQSLNELWSAILIKMKSILEDFRPDWVFVHGDTATSSAAALASYFSGIKVAHVEAGLRTYNKWAPFPEEMNRQLTGRIADLHFAPTDLSRCNLLNEGISDNKIVVTGNTVVDALLLSVNILSSGYSCKEIRMLDEILNPAQNVILVTGHRRENFGKGFIDICEALKELAERSPDVQIIYPVHLNPNVQKPVLQILSGINNIKLINPLPYPAFVWIMNKSKLIITDSGGVQEEAPSLGKPVLVMRDTTERPEAVESGTAILVGTDKKKIIEESLSFLTDHCKYKKTSDLKNPYGDGSASKRIVESLKSL